MVDRDITMSTTRKTNRREFIQIAAGGAAAVYLGGCSTTRESFAELSPTALGPVEKSNWGQLAQLALSRIKKGGCAYGDIRLLVKAFLSDEWEIEPAALEAIEKYHWPGNVRQLINALERAQIMADDGMIRSYDLPPEVLRPEAVDGSAQEPSEDELASIQRSHIVEVLRREQGNKARTARKLGINRRSLYRLIEKYQIGAADLSETV